MLIGIFCFIWSVKAVTGFGPMEGNKKGLNRS